MTYGTLVVDECWRFPIVAVRLREGRVEYHAFVRGPLAALPPADYQFVLLGEDGTVVARHRVEMGWPEIQADETLTVVQPVAGESSQPEAALPW